jgi:hypothetical protein
MNDNKHDFTRGEVFGFGEGLVYEVVVRVIALDATTLLRYGLGLEPPQTLYVFAGKESIRIRLEGPALFNTQNS